jgi:hypothetical protein
MTTDTLERPDAQQATSPNPNSVNLPDVPQPGFNAEPTFEDAMREWDAAPPPPDAPEPEAEAVTPEADAPQTLEDSILALQNSAEVRQGRHQLLQFADSLQRERDNLDFRSLVQYVRAAMPDVLSEMSTETLQALLVGAAKVDGRIAEAWQGRYARPRQWETRLTNLMHKLRSDLSRRPDAEATETKYAVADAVRRGGYGNGRPDRPAPNYNDLTDKEFAQYIAREFGIEGSRLL